MFGTCESGYVPSDLWKCLALVRVVMCLWIYGPFGTCESGYVP